MRLSTQANFAFLSLVFFVRELKRKVHGCSEKKNLLCISENSQRTHRIYDLILIAARVQLKIVNPLAKRERERVVVGCAHFLSLLRAKILSNVFNVTQKTQNGNGHVHICETNCYSMHIPSLLHGHIKINKNSMCEMCLHLPHSMPSFIFKP